MEGLGRGDKIADKGQKGIGKLIFQDTFLDASSHLFKRVRRSVRQAFFSMSRLLEKMVRNDRENSVKAPNS